MKSANANTNVKGNSEPEPFIPTENPVAKNPRDAQEEKEKMKQNRKKLGVEEDHKTKDMEKSNRGTFP